MSKRSIKETKGADFHPKKMKSANPHGLSERVNSNKSVIENVPPNCPTPLKNKGLVLKQNRSLNRPNILSQAQSFNGSGADQRLQSTFRPNNTNIKLICSKTPAKQNFRNTLQKSTSATCTSGPEFLKPHFEFTANTISSATNFQNAIASGSKEVVLENELAAINPNLLSNMQLILPFDGIDENLINQQEEASTSFNNEENIYNGLSNDGENNADNTSEGETEQIVDEPDSDLDYSNEENDIPRQVHNQNNPPVSNRCQNNLPAANVQNENNPPEEAVHRQHNILPPNAGNLLELEHESHNANTCCSSCRTVLLHILRKVDQILLMRNQPININNNNAVRETFNELQMLPINDRDDLDEFDRSLQHPQNQRRKCQLEQKIAAVGGETWQKAINNIMSTIMTDELAENCTWIITKPGKTKLLNFNFPNIITNYIKGQFSVSEESIKKRIQLWLQKAGDRRKAKIEQERREEEIRRRQLE